MSTIIRTRSPYFIRTPEETDATLGYFIIQISIKVGSLTELTPCSPASNLYILNKKPLGAETSVSFDISEIVNDSFIQNYTSLPSAIYQSLWVIVSTSASTLAGAPIGNVTTTTYLAQEGYNTFKEGVNYTGQKQALISENYLEYNKGKHIYLPINNETVDNVTFNYNGSLVQSFNISDTGYSGQKIKYIQFNSAVGTVDEAVVSLSGANIIIIKLREIEECKYPVNKITFLNRWGAFQDLFFFKKSTESLNTTSENYNASIFEARNVQLSPPRPPVTDCLENITYNTYSVNEHSKKTYNANGVESITLNSGYVSELNNSYFQELMVSEYVWLTDYSEDDSGVIYPVNLKESSFNKKTGLNDGLINYTMSFEKSFSIVNNIR